MQRILPVVVVAFSIGCGTAPSQLPPQNDGPAVELEPQQLWLEDVTASSGIDYSYRNGQGADQYTILESLGGGVGLIDYDRDGLLDVLLPGGGTFEAGPRIVGYPTKLYRNLGKLKFADATEAAGLAHEAFYTHGCAVADYDRDGWPDLLLTGYGRLALLHNVAGEQGERRFVETTKEAQLDDALWSTSAGWGDVDGDGDPDLFVCHYVDWSWDNNPVCPKAGTPHNRQVCGPEKFKPLPDALYVNNGDGTFTDASERFAIRRDGKGLGVLLADLDDDRRPDIYVANDGTDNFLYLHRDGSLEERAAAAGVAMNEEGRPDGSMGIDVVDYDGSGRASLVVTNFERELHALYANLGKGIFQHRSKAAGLAMLGRRFVSFGVGAADFNNDGWEDLLIVSGHVFQQPDESTFLQKPVCLENVDQQGRRLFRQNKSACGQYGERAQLGRGLALGDLDNDGWPDAVISHSNTPVAVLHNVAAKSESRGWLGLELVGRDQRDLVGTTVTLESGGRTLTRFVKGGGSYLSSGDRRLLFGLSPEAKIDRIVVRWSWGEMQEFRGCESNRYYRLTEGESEVTRQE